MKSFIFLCFLLFSQGLVAQIKINARVQDAGTGKKIPYASIGLVKQNIGATTDENGWFTIISTAEADSLLISCTGYISRRFAISSLKETDISLEKNIVSLGEVAVVNRKNQAILGEKSRNTWYWLTSNQTMVQVAQAFSINASLSKIKKITLYKSGGFAHFRFRVYEADSTTGRPGKELCDSVIDVTTNSKKVEVDVQAYNIVIPGNHFFVAVEYIFTKENEIKDKYKKEIHTNYSPWICMRDNQLGEHYYNNFQLTFSGKWLPLIEGKEICMSVSLSY